MNVRPFEAEDAEAVASLWRYWFHDKVRGPAPKLARLARRWYAEHPFADLEVPSLVATDDDGKLVGFLGVMVTPVEVDGKPGRLAGIFPPVLDPEGAPTTLAALLLRRFLAGPQDFTFSDGGHPKFERIWTSLGGEVAPLASIRWIKLLRPVELMAGARIERPWLRRVLQPVARGSDGLLRRGVPGFLTAAPIPLPGGRSAASHHKIITRQVSANEWEEAAASLRSEARLRPCHTPDLIAWLTHEISSVERLNPVQLGVAEDEYGSVVGTWFTSVPVGDLARVFSLSAKPRWSGEVVNAMLADAEAGGATAVMGRLDPVFRRAITDARCLLHAGGSLQLLHARDRTLLRDALLGNVAFSRLDGEAWSWWAIEGIHAGHASTEPKRGIRA